MNQVDKNELYPLAQEKMEATGLDEALQGWHSELILEVIKLRKKNYSFLEEIFSISKDIDEAIKQSFIEHLKENGQSVSLAIEMISQQPFFENKTDS